MRLTKQRVRAIISKHGPDVYPPVGPMCGDLVDFIANDMDIEDRARVLARRWGWIDEYDRVISPLPDF